MPKAKTSVHLFVYHPVTISGDEKSTEGSGE